MAEHNRANANRPAAAGRQDGAGKLLAVHFATALLVVVDFIMFQAAAAGATAAIYYTVPALDSGIVRGESSWTWIRIFQIVSPTITLPGGVATVLSSYFFARRAQQVEAQARAEVQQAQDETQQAQEQTRAATQRAESEAQRAQNEAQRAQDESRRADSEAQRAQELTHRVEATEAQLENLKARLERRSGRRRLRNGATPAQS